MSFTIQKKYRITFAHMGGKASITRTVFATDLRSVSSAARAADVPSDYIMVDAAEVSSGVVGVRNRFAVPKLVKVKWKKSPNYDDNGQYTVTFHGKNQHGKVVQGTKRGVFRAPRRWAGGRSGWFVQYRGDKRKRGYKTLFLGKTRADVAVLLLWLTGLKPREKQILDMWGTYEYSGWNHDNVAPEGGWDLARGSGSRSRGQRAKRTKVSLPAKTKWHEQRYYFAHGAKSGKKSSSVQYHIDAVAASGRKVRLFVRLNENYHGKGIHHVNEAVDTTVRGKDVQLNFPRYIVWGYTELRTFLLWYLKDN